MINCPVCNTENPAGAKFCENCGNVINKPNEKQTNDLNFCPNCGKSSEIDATFCAHCGTSFGEQCPHCQTANQSDAKFCEKCAQPLNWICPICNSKNQAGAIFCASCGSADVAPKKNLVKRLVMVAASVLVLMLVGYGGFNAIKINELLDTAEASIENNNFEDATQTLNKASAILLPWKSKEIVKTKNYLYAQQDNYEAEKKRIATANANKRSSSGRSQHSSVNNSRSSTTTTYKKFAAIEFNYSGSVKDATLSVSAPNNSYIQSISGNTAYVGANNSIRGNYTFKWTFDSNNNYLLDPKYKTLSGTFFIDGLNGSYQVSIDDGFGGVTVEVNGY